VPAVRRLGLAFLCACALGALSATAAAAPSIRFGIVDDAWLAHGPGTLEERVEKLERVGFDVVRLTLRWDEIERAKGTYDWEAPDRLLGALQARALTPIVSLYGSPRWANGGRTPNWAPTRATDFATFAREVATRYPFVREWLVWNEPNQRRWLRPTSAVLYTTRLLNPAYVAIKQVQPTDRVGGGVTAPRGSTGGVSPVQFIRAMKAAGARLDAYAHHPYPLTPTDTPSAGGCEHCETISMAKLERLLSEVRQAFPTARVWLTEYGYQTNPPDRFLGVSPELQARYVGEATRRAYAAPKVDLLVQHLYRDEPDLGRWQSGLETVAGREKPALRATMLPLTQLSRSGAAVVVWGQVRPGSGPQRYVLQVWRDGWRAVGGEQGSSSRGYFTRTIRAAKGAKLRIWYPAEALASPALVIR
jgi:hypothetical protein